MSKRIGSKRRTKEFKAKQKGLALFLFNMNNGPLDTIESVKEWDKTYYKNYMADANDILRSQPHLLGYATRETMNLF